MHMAATMRLVLALALVAMATTTTTMAQNSAQDYLDIHNQARREVGLGEVGWDMTLQAYAEWWADQRRGICGGHSSTPGYGENIYWGSAGKAWTGVDAVNTWVKEKESYDYDSNTCWGEFGCGHYTQVVWQETTWIGCARVDCDNDLGVFITCNYYPPGNVDGRRPWTLAARAAAAFFFFFAEMELIISEQVSYRKTQEQRKNTLRSILDPSFVNDDSTLRRRNAAATPPLNAWTGRSPLQTGSRRSSAPKEPPSCASDVASLLCIITTIEIYGSRNRRPTDSGAGKKRSTTPPSRERAKGGRSAAELHQSTHSGGEGRHPQKPLRPRRILLSATGWHPRATYTMYTPGSVDSPSSRRRSGRRRARNRADRRR